MGKWVNNQAARRWRVALASWIGPLITGDPMWGTYHCRWRADVTGRKRRLENDATPISAPCRAGRLSLREGLWRGAGIRLLNGRCS